MDTEGETLYRCESKENRRGKLLFKVLLVPGQWRSDKDLVPLVRRLER